jgi:IS30 family transposase
MKKVPRALPLLPTPKFAAPFRAWAVDYLPRLPETAEGYKHLLILVDPFSKWTELVPMKTKTSSEVAEAIRLHILARFGVPKELRFDRGREFAGEVK